MLILKNPENLMSAIDQVVETELCLTLLWMGD